MVLAGFAPPPSLRPTPSLTPLHCFTFYFRANRIYINTLSHLHGVPAGWPDAAGGGQGVAASRASGEASRRHGDTAPRGTPACPVRFRSVSVKGRGLHEGRHPPPPLSDASLHGHRVTVARHHSARWTFRPTRELTSKRFWATQCAHTEHRRRDGQLLARRAVSTSPADKLGCARAGALPWRRRTRNRRHPEGLERQGARPARLRSTPRLPAPAPLERRA